MSDDYLPSQLVVEANGDDFDDFLDPSFFEEDNLRAVFAQDQVPDLPGETIYHQDVDSLERPEAQEPPQESISNPLGVEQSNYDLLGLDHQPQSVSKEPVECREEASNQDWTSQVNESNNYGGSIESQPQITVTSGDGPPHSYHDNLGAGDLSNIDQSAEGLSNEEQPPEFQFDVFASKEWQDYIKYTTNGDLADILGTGLQEEQQTHNHSNDKHTGSQDHFDQHAIPKDNEPYPQRDVGPFPDAAPSTSSTLQWSPVKTPDIDSGYGTAAMSRDASLGMIPTTPHQSVNAARRHSPSDMHGASSGMNLAASPPTDRNPAAVNNESSQEPIEHIEGAIVPNQVAFETYEEDDPLINIYISQKGWGQTGSRNGQEVWFNPETSEWQPSASHHDMRATLIARAQAEYPNDGYLHPDPTDGLPHGNTAFFKPHQDRGPNRHQCADELFVWREYQPKKDKNGKKIRKGKPKYTIKDHPGYMYEGDKILLDPHNNPVVNHNFIPLTLSVYTDGAKLQEMALKPGCRQVDLWARMPRWEKKADKEGRFEIIPLRDKNTRINMPMTRFREKKGTIAGGDREGTEVIMAGLARFYRHHGFDPIASDYSVKAFPRDLLPWEVKEVRLGNTARFGGRAGNRALDDEKREGNLQKTLKAIENGKKRQAANDEDGAVEQRVERGDSGSQGSVAGPQKRRRRGQEVNVGVTAWHEGYAGQHGAPSVEDGQNSFDLQWDFNQQQGGYSQASRPPQAHFNAYGAAESSYENLDLQVQPLPTQNSSNFDQISPNVGTFPTPSRNVTPQASYGGVHMQVARSPYENAQAQASSENSLISNKYGNKHYPEGQHLQSDAWIQSGPTGGLNEPQQRPYRGNYPGTIATNHHNIVHNRPTSQVTPGYHFRGPVSSNHYGPPVQRQEPYRVNAAPERTGNQFGPGGRTLYHAPQQVLGKRGQLADSEIQFNENCNYETQQQSANSQYTPNADGNPQQKRRRTDATSGAEPRQQRRRHNERDFRPQYYGAVGAPQPLIPPHAFPFGPQSLIPPEAFSFVPAQANSDYTGSVRSPLKTPEELIREYGHIFQDAAPIATMSRNVDQGITSTAAQHSEDQRLPGGSEQRQVLGKHGRREKPLGQRGGEDVYVPQQNLGQQGPEGYHGAPEQDIYEPGPKRRRMPRREG